jgi:hypothetical protein
MGSGSLLQKINGCKWLPTRYEILSTTMVGLVGLFGCRDAINRRLYNQPSTNAIAMLATPNDLLVQTPIYRVCTSRQLERMAPD